MEHYHVFEMIGGGSFGRVYRGRQKYSRRIVALKLISKARRSEHEVRSIKREIDIMRDLKHPNIIQLLDSFETEKEVVLVTECAVGELYQVLLSDGSLPEKQVRDIACQLVSALYYLHSQRILHRDMKPQNILLDKGGVVKLCDFGFAQVMSMSTLVLTSIKGTPLYMSPEVLKEQPYDHTADLWSLGCILYELHLGVPPFYQASFRQLRELIVQSPVKWPENMSHSCKSFLMGLLTKDPQKRLTWPALLHHPFVADRIKLLPNEDLCCPLTVTPSADMLALKQCQAKEKMAMPRKNQLLHRIIECNKMEQKRKQDQREKDGHTCLSQSKTTQAGDAPAAYNSPESTFTVCQNPPSSQNQANDSGVASLSLTSCKGPISVDFEREFPSVEVGPRMVLKCSGPRSTTVNSSVHQTLEEKLIAAINQATSLKRKVEGALRDCSVPEDAHCPHPDL